MQLAQEVAKEIGFTILRLYLEYKKRVVIRRYSFGSHSACKTDPQTDRTIKQTDPQTDPTPCKAFMGVPPPGAMLTWNFSIFRLIQTISQSSMACFCFLIN